MIDQSTQRVSYLRRLVTVALTLGIVIATFDILSKGEQFFVPLVMAVLAVYLVFAMVLITLPAQGWAMFITSNDAGIARQADMASIQKTLEFDAGLATHPTAPAQQLPAHFLKFVGDRFTS